MGYSEGHPWPDTAATAEAPPTSFDIGFSRLAGWIVRRVKGSHHHFTHPTKPGVVTVPHPRRDIMIDTLRSIYRQAGWDWRDR